MGEGIEGPNCRTSVRSSSGQGAMTEMQGQTFQPPYRPQCTVPRFYKVMVSEVIFWLGTT